MHFTLEAQKLIRQHVESTQPARPWVAVDATCGNGFDTLFLASLVGTEGRVVAIDIQPQAIEITRNKLNGEKIGPQVALYCGCHSRLDDYLNSEAITEVAVSMFNLGYLPFGNKEIITNKETTLLAVERAFQRLAISGILTILSYPGHPGGQEEQLAIEAWMRVHSHALSMHRFCDPENAKSPVLWVVRRLEGA